MLLPVVTPTDNHIVPSRSDILWNGMGEGKDLLPAQPMVAPVQK
jgi:hypothetical protein